MGKPWTIGSLQLKFICISDLVEDVNLTPSLLEHLERLSLVDFSNKEAVDRLKEAIKFAQPLQNIDTEVSLQEK